MDKINKKIVEMKDSDSLYIKNNKVFNIYEYEEFRVIRLRNVDVSCRYEIMRYTGLKDKNGKEIYEGDIVRDDIESNTPHIVEYRGEFAQYCLKNMSKEREAFLFQSRYTDMFDGCCEVIGNIYEKPELLEGDKE